MPDLLSWDRHNLQNLAEVSILVNLKILLEVQGSQKPIKTVFNSGVEEISLNFKDPLPKQQMTIQMQNPLPTPDQSEFSLNKKQIQALKNKERIHIKSK